VTRRLRSLKWLTILGPVVFVALLVYAAYFHSPAFLPPLAAFLSVLLVTALAASASSHLLFQLVSARDHEITRQRRELHALNQISEAVSASLDLVEILSRALDAILELTHAAAGRVWLVDDESNTLQNAVHRGLFPDAFAQPVAVNWGEGWAGSVALSTQVRYVADLARSTDVELDAIRARGFVELASVPLIAREQVVGVMDIAARHHGELTAATLDLLALMGREVGLAIENARLFDAARARQREAESLYKAGMDVSSKLDLSEVLRTVTERGRSLLNVDASALCLWDEQKRWLVVGSESGPADAFESQVGLGRRVAQKIRLLRVDAAHDEDDCVTCAMIRAPYRQAHVELPLRLGDQVIGCLCMASARARVFSDREIEVLGGLADQAAIAIQNANAYDRAGNAAIVMERERLAREMHDTLAQVLGFVSTKSQAAHELLNGGQMQAAAEQLDQITALSRELYADVREAILGLRAAISPEKSLVPALGDYLQAYSKQSGVPTQLLIEEAAGQLTFAPAVELQLIRIVQEALTNVRKHAHARHAVVHLALLDGHAEMRIEDDGLGFDPAHIARGNWPQFGLQTMRERAESVGGAFFVVSRPNVGTQIVVEIPLGYTGGR
jgi:signal transduction histidine kinase